METTIYGDKLDFNEGKITKMLAAARIQEQVQVVSGILNSSSIECETIAVKGMCNKSEIMKVKAMIRNTMHHVSEVLVKKQVGEGAGGFMLSMFV